ncbi:MAG: ATP-binding protein [Candidatus Eremiobacteraeota bacterium]|nr:ATP-binding protein [Candidatus Eremiobacteraeota bacterium]
MVAVVGARQVGKTSLARHFKTGDRVFVSLDDFGSLTQAQADPIGFVDALGRASIVDEIQRAPDLLLAIKSVVDRDAAKGRFLLTGSADIMALPNLADSLAGRMTVFELFPFAEAEIERALCNIVEQLFAPERPWLAVACDQAEVVRRIVRGGYPEAVFSRNSAARDRWFASYLLAMIQRDIRDIAQVGDIAAMGRLLAVLATRTGRIVNYTSLSSEAGIPKSTLLRYVTLLEQTFLVHRMPAWSFDLGRRLTKLPKLFLGDVGVAAHLMHADTARLLADRNLLGGLLETFVANELRKHASWSDRRTALYHYREHDGVEVDFILETAAGERVAVEVKATASPTHADVRGLLRLMDDAKLGLVRGIILHTGSTIVPIRRNVHGVPISVFWTDSAA